MKILLFIIRTIGVLASLAFILTLYTGINEVSKTVNFQENMLANSISLAISTLPPFILAILILLPWRKIKNGKLWHSIFITLVLTSTAYLLTIYKANYRHSDSIPFLLVATTIILLQIISIWRIRQTNRTS